MKQTRTLLISILCLLAACVNQPDRRISAHRIILKKPLLDGADSNAIYEGRMESSGSFAGTNTNPPSSSAVNAPKVPIIRIALTNASLHTLCNVKAEVLGLDSNELHIKGKGQRYSRSPTAEKNEKFDLMWKPGGVWLLPLAVRFKCRIPVYVEVTYDYYKLNDAKFIQKHLKKNGVLKDTKGTDVDFCEHTLKKYLIKTPTIELVALPKQPTAISPKNLLDCMH